MSGEEDMGEARLPLGDSVLSSWIRSICQTARGLGLDAELLMKKSGMDLSLLNVPDARFPTVSVRCFWENLVSATGDRLIGLQCGKEMQVSTLHGLGLALITSHSLAQLLTLLSCYCKVISSTMDMWLSHDKAGTTLTVKTLHGAESSHSATLAILAFVNRQANSLSQHRVTPLHVRFRMPNLSPEDGKRLDDHFGCPVDTMSDEPDSIRFSYSDVVEPYAGSNAMLREANERITLAYLNRVRKNSFRDRVEEEIVDLMDRAEEVRIEPIASKLHLSVRTLQRRLETEGVTFAELFDRIRKQRAHDALAHTEESITEIAYNLGFSDPSNFSRSCTRWFGTSPAVYRRRIRGIQT